MMQYSAWIYTHWWMGQTHVFTIIKPMNQSEILYNTKELLCLLYTHECVWTKISFTANKTPLTETYFTMWNISHGNKNEYLWWLITSRIGKPSTVVSLTISLIILSHYNLFMILTEKTCKFLFGLPDNLGNAEIIGAGLDQSVEWCPSKHGEIAVDIFLLCTAPILAMVSLPWEQTGIHTSKLILHCHIALSFRQIPAFLKYPNGIEPFAYKIIYKTKNFRENLLKYV